MGKKKKTAETNDMHDEYAVQPQTAESGKATPAAEELQPAAKTKKSKGGKAKMDAVSTTGGITLYDVSERYLAWLDADGAGDGTIASYGMELKLAQRELGETTLISDLTPEKIQAYFNSDAVTKTRTGAVKAKPTVDKTRRVIRLALVWAAAEKLIDFAPIPESKKTALKAV